MDNISLVLLISTIILSSNFSSLAAQSSSAVNDNFLEEFIPNPFIAVTPNCLNRNCNITCRDGLSQLLSAHIDESNTVADCRLISLTIYNYRFPNDQIEAYWTPTNLSILELRIVSSTVHFIQPYAFAVNKTFQYLHFLVLQDLNIIYLEADVFCGLTSLIQLEIIQYSPAIESIDDAVLLPMQYKICTLKINAAIANPRHLTNGAALLSSLTKVDLSHNSFYNVIRRNSFNKLSTVESLDLSYCHITILPPNVFESIAKTIRILDLSNNMLLTLPPFSFKTLLASTKVQVNLINNKWDCTCELQKTVKVLKNPTMATCRTPPDLFRVRILTADLCESESGDQVHIVSPILETSLSDSGETTTALPFTTRSSISTTMTYSIFSPPENQGIKILCQICAVADCSGDTPTHYERLQIRGRDEHISVVVVNKTSVQVDISNTEGYGYGLLWFSNATKFYYEMEINYKDFGLGCSWNVMKPVTVHNLVPNTTYTFCIIRSGEDVTSPFNCISHHIESQTTEAHNMWLTRDTKFIGISLLIFGITFAMFFGGWLIYYVIRRQPTLIKGNKCVITVAKDTKEATVHPRTESLKKDTRKMENSSIKKRLPMFIRKNSTCSVDSNISYVSPNLYEVIPANKTKEIEDSARPTIPKRLSSDPLPLTPLEQHIGSSCHNCFYIDNNHSNYL